VPNILVYFWKN